MCPVVGHREFQSENVQWPPPQAALHLQDGKASIYYKGRFTPSKPEDVVGLELAQVCELEHIVERILKTQTEPDREARAAGS